MMIVPTDAELQREYSAVSLARYAQIIGACECAFWGVRGGNGVCGRGNSDIWTLAERMTVARYLAEAQSEIEDVLGYPVGERQILDEPVRIKQYAPRSTAIFRARYARVQAVGVWDYTTLAAGVAVDFSEEPALVIVPSATPVNTNDVIVYHVDTTLRIIPSSIYAITNPVVGIAIEIPRCRLVKPEFAANPVIGWDFGELSVFADRVDVVIRNIAQRDRATLYIQRCGDICEYEPRTVKACVYSSRLGIIEAQIASCVPGSYLLLDYIAGTEATLQEQDTIVRLAHAKMPEPACDAGWPAAALWKRDRNVPQVLTAERLNCRFGLSDGAWTAWQFAQAMRQVRGGVL